MKKSFIVALSFVSLLILSACGNQTRAKLRGTLEGISETCPLVVDQTLSLTGMKMNEDTVQIDYQSVDDVKPYELFQENADMRRNLLHLLVKGQTKLNDQLMTDVIKEKMWIKMCFAERENKGKTTLLFSPEEIEKAISTPMSKRDFAEAVIDLKADLVKKTLPKEYAKDIILVDVKKNDADLTYLHSADKKNVEMVSTETGKYTFKRELSDKLVYDKDLLNALVDSKRELKYVLKEEKSGKAEECVFTVNELKNMSRR